MGQSLSSENGMQSGKLQIPSPFRALATFYLQLTQARAIKMFKGSELIGIIFQNQTGGNINGPHNISLLWEYDSASSEGRKDPAFHPLDRNKLQMQFTEHEAEMMGLTNLQLVKAWEDINRILHPPPIESEGCE
jgi:hypothetical protein